MSGGGKTTTTRNDPWGPAQPVMQKAFSSASSAFDATPKTPYSGSYFARPNAVQKDAVGSALAAAPGLSTGSTELRGYGQDLLNGKYLDPSTNPWVKGMAEAATRGATDNWNNNIRPGLDSQAIAQGAYGGSKNGIATALGASEVDKNVRDTYANIYGGNYAAERGYMDNAGKEFAAANSLALQPSQVQAAAGDQLQSWDQNLIKEALAKWDESKSAPWSGIQQLVSAISGTSGQGSTSATTTPGVPWWQQALQGGIAGLGFLGSL